MKLRSQSITDDTKSTNTKINAKLTNQSKKRARNNDSDRDFNQSVIDESDNQSINSSEQSSNTIKPPAKKSKRRDYFNDKRRQLPASDDPRKFNYELDYRSLDLRQQPDLYRVGKGEQGVLMVEPYKAEICPLWTFKTPEIARSSAEAITKLFYKYKKANDFIGMDMARKFLQMGYTRARRYANHASGRKYDEAGKVLPIDEDPIKAESARVFYPAWKAVEADEEYAEQKKEWKKRLG